MCTPLDGRKIKPGDEFEHTMNGKKAICTCPTDPAAFAYASARMSCRYAVSGKQMVLVELCTVDYA